jgi:hypothetical protein
MSAADAKIAATVAALEIEYRATLDREIKLVDALTPKSTKAQVDRAWAASENTNAVLRRLMAAREAYALTLELQVDRHVA